MFNLALILLLLPTPISNRWPVGAPQSVDILSTNSSSITFDSGHPVGAPSSSILELHGLHTVEPGLDDDIGDNGICYPTRPVNWYPTSSYGVPAGIDQLVAHHVANSSSTESFVGPLATQAQLLSQAPAYDSSYVRGALPVYTCYAAAVIPDHRLEGHATNPQARLRLNNVCYEWCRTWAAPTLIPVPAPVTDTHQHRGQTKIDTELTPLPAFVRGALTLDTGANGVTDIASQPPYTQPVTPLAGSNTLLLIVIIAFLAVFIVAAGLGVVFVILRRDKGHHQVVASLQATVSTLKAEASHLESQVRFGNTTIARLGTANTVLAINLQSESASARALLQESESNANEERHGRVSAEEEIAHLRDDVAKYAEMARVSEEALIAARDGQMEAEDKAERLEAANTQAEEDKLEAEQEILLLRESLRSGTQDHAEEKRVLLGQLRLWEEQTKAQTTFATASSDALMSKVGKLYRQLGDVELKLEAANSTTASQDSQLRIQALLLQSKDATIEQLRNGGARLDSPIATTSDEAQRCEASQTPDGDERDEHRAASSPAAPRERQTLRVQGRGIFEAAMQRVAQNPPAPRRLL